MSARTSRPHRLLVVLALALVLGGCSLVGDEAAESSRNTVPAGAAGADGGGDGEDAPFVQDLWLYDRIATIDDEGDVVDITDEVLDTLSGDPRSSFDLGGGVAFHDHGDLSARMADAAGEVRDDLEVLAGVLEAHGDRMIAVLATPDEATERPIDHTDRVQIDLTAVQDVLAPGDPLIADVGFVQAYGAADGFEGAELLAHRLAEGRANIVGADDDGVTRMLFSTEIGSAVAGSVWSDLPAKSHRMMDGFSKGFQGCKGGLKCVKNYFDEMVDVAVDFGTAFDCNLGVGWCPPEPDPDPEPPRTTTSSTSTSTTTTTTTPPPPPPPPPPTPSGPLPKVHGDPHLTTFDGHDYGMQAVGEFVLARSDDLEVQIRTAAWGSSGSVSVLSGVAVHVEGHTLSVAGGVAHLDGEVLAPGEPAESVELGEALLVARGSGYEITTATGQQVVMTGVSGMGFELWMALDEDDDTEFAGLFGDNDGDPSNDHRTRDGEVLEDPDFDELYGTFVESWRLDEDESHFHYEDGEDTETFTDRSLPREPVTIDTLPAADRARGEAICRAAGVTDDVTLEQCTIDYAMTGEIGFVRAALTIDTVVGIWEGRLLEDGSDASVVGPDDGHGPDDEDADRADDPGDVRTVVAPWARTARAIREGDEELTRVTCPADGSAHVVWGTDVYTDDSSVCTAAVHRGLLSFEDGGEVLIEHRPGLGSYRGSTRNGVTTAGWGSWPGSFVFIGARGVAIEGD